MEGIHTYQNSELTANKISKNSNPLQWVSLIARIVLGQMLLISGAEKLVALTTFSHSIGKYQLIPEALNNMLALCFVWAEITVGIMLLIGLFTRGSALLSAVMLAVFTTAIIIAVLRGLEIDCGCFAKPEPVGWFKVLKNSGWILLSLFLYFFPKSNFSVDNSRV